VVLLALFLAPTARLEAASTVPDAAASKRNASVETCGYCSEYSYVPFAPVQHKFPGGASGCGATDDSSADASGVEYVDEGGECDDCQAFNSCHTNDQAGKCYEWHWACGLHDAEISDIERVARTENANAIAALLRVHGSKVKLAGGRRAIQVVACTGSVIAQIALTDATLAAVEQAVAGAQ
jgi:hypothetical protein